MDLEHVMVNGIWYLVFVLPDDLFFASDLKEPALWPVTDQGVTIRQPLCAAQVDCGEISRLFRDVPPD